MQHEALLAEWQKVNPTALKGMDGAKTFMSGGYEAGSNWADQNLAPVPQGSKSVVTSFTGSGSSAWNSSMWNVPPEPMPTHLSNTVKKLDAAMAPLPEDIYLFRGTDHIQFGTNNFTELKALEGATLQQNAYQSTSIGQVSAFSGKAVQIAFRAPKGTLGIWAKPESSHKAENEYILARQTRYFIHKVYEKHGTTFVEAEIIPEGHPDPTGQPTTGITTPQGVVGQMFATTQGART